MLVYKWFSDRSALYVLPITCDDSTAMLMKEPSIFSVVLSLWRVVLMEGDILKCWGTPGWVLRCWWCWWQWWWWLCWYNDEHADVDVDNKGVNGDGDRGKMVLMVVTASDIPRLTSSSPLDSVKREGVRGVSTIMWVIENDCHDQCQLSKWWWTYHQVGSLGSFHMHWVDPGISKEAKNHPQVETRWGEVITKIHIIQIN